AAVLHPNRVAAPGEGPFGREAATLEVEGHPYLGPDAFRLEAGGRDMGEDLGPEADGPAGAEGRAGHLLDEGAAVLQAEIGDPVVEIGRILGREGAAGARVRGKDTGLDRVAEERAEDPDLGVAGV